MKKKYSVGSLDVILEEMASYVQSLTIEETTNYFKEITQSGLFHDAIGKVVELKENEVVVVEEY